MMKTLPEKELLRPEEVADFWSVSVKTIYRWIDLGIIPAEKKGGTVRIRRIEAEKGEPVID